MKQTNFQASSAISLGPIKNESVSHFVDNTFFQTFVESENYRC